MKVFTSVLAENKLKKLTDFLLEDWSYKVKKGFLTKLTAKIDQISLKAAKNQWNLGKSINA